MEMIKHILSKVKVSLREEMILATTNNITPINLLTGSGKIWHIDT